MSKKTARIEHKIKGFIIERNLHRTWKERLFHTLCLIVPIISAFAGYFLCPVIFEKRPLSETVKFITTMVFFAIPAVIIFIASRGTNPIMKISVTDEKKSSESDSQNKPQA